jgi:tetraacyldisaccharide 4'-kinase
MPPIPVVSVGNLTVGGSGKTPFLIALAKERENIAVVLRGYKRDSTGTILISQNGNILQGVQTSGDEAMLYALSLPKASVIVSEDRMKGIKLAQDIGAKAVFLDDGFSKAFIFKFDILLRPTPEPKLPFCLPSGAYREPKFFYSFAQSVLQEGKDFQREVTILEPSKKMVLVTAISKPHRLLEYVNDNVIAYEFFPDHYAFHKKELEDILSKHQATSILTTSKDMVKMKDFQLPLSLLSLHVKITPSIKEQVNSFLANFRYNKDF